MKLLNQFIQKCQGCSDRCTGTCKGCHGRCTATSASDGCTWCDRGCVNRCDGGGDCGGSCKDGARKEGVCTTYI